LGTTVITADTLLDLRRIEQLKYDYCWAYDSGDVDALLQVFTSDAVCDMGFFGTWRGLAEIRAGYAGLMASTGIPGSRRHMPGNPQITLGGRAARGRWYLVDYRTEPGVEQPTRIIASYVDDYLREDDRWLISRTALEVHWVEP
jgi:ketosteroid isomerase-like protein